MAEPGATGSKRGFSPLVYRDPRPSSALIRALGPVNRHIILPHLLKLRGIDLPSADIGRLRAAIHPGAAAFIGPNHPEFFTDWMLDKEISWRVSPLMAHWASYEIVNLNPWVQGFWLRNNLISNAPGGGGAGYSIRWALAGHGVLLHPEGTATWHSDDVGPLVPGIVEMAWRTCHRAREAGRATPVFIVPVVWKLHFLRDVSGELGREMALIERRLGLPPGRDLAVEERFASLLGQVLAHQCGRMGAPAPALDLRRPGPGLFDAQRSLADFLRADLEQRHGQVEGDIARVIHVLRRRAHKRATADPEGSRRDRRKVDEIERLNTFTRERYGGPWLTQEHMAENLKRQRTSLLTRSIGDALHGMVPVPVAPRAVHIRVPEPIAVHEAFTDDAAGADRAKAQLLETLSERLQAGLDGLKAEVVPAVAPFRRPNPMHGGAGTGAGPAT